MLLLHDRSPQEARPEDEADALIREARRLRRRRWMRGLGALIAAGACIGVAVVEINSSSSRGHKTRSGHSPAPAVPGGAFVTPNTPASLAVGPNGALYVLDSGRDQILRRSPDGRFQVVAGTGERGFSRDGGSALQAKLRLGFYSGLTIASNGTVYFSDSGNNRVRAVLPNGAIETIAGGGSHPIGSQPIPADTARLASGKGSSDEVAGLAIGPNHELYIGLQTGVYRLTHQHMLVHVIGSQVKPSKLTAWNASPGNPEDFLGVTRLSFDRHGDLFAVGGGAGWGLYERTTSGALRFVQVLRGGAQCCASGNGAIASDPDGQVVTASNYGIQTTDPAGGLRSVAARQMRLERNLNQVFANASNDRLAEFRPGGGIAVAADGTIYVDADAGMFSPVGGILAVTPHGHVTALWLSRIHKF